MFHLTFLLGHIVLVTELMVRPSKFLSKIQGWNDSPFPHPTPAGAHDDVPGMWITRAAFVRHVQHLTTTTHYDDLNDKHNNSERAKTKITANTTENCDEGSQPMFVTSRQVYVGASLLMTVMGSTNAIIKGSNRLIRNKDIPWVSTHFERINCFKNMCCTIARPHHVLGSRLNKGNQKLSAYDKRKVLTRSLNSIG